MSEDRGNTVAEERVCAGCGRRVWADDPYCPGCGIAFGNAPDRAERGTSLPGFGYHFVQGLGWGLGLALAGLVAWMITVVFLGLAVQGIR